MRSPTVVFKLSCKKKQCAQVGDRRIDSGDGIGVAGIPPVLVEQAGYVRCQVAFAPGEGWRVHLLLVVQPLQLHGVGQRIFVSLGAIVIIGVGQLTDELGLGQLDDVEDAGEA